MSFRFPRFGATLLLALSCASPALAEGKWTGNIALTNDYVWRGVSQSDNSPAISGGVDYTNGLFYAGAWASNVDFGSDASVEADLYAGLGTTYESGFGWNVGAIGYLYPGESDLDFLELTGGVALAVEGGLSLAADVYYDPDNKNTYLEGKVGYAFTEKFSGDFTAGNYDFDAGASYANYSIGAAYAFEAVTLGVRVSDTDIDDAFAGDVADENLIVSLSKTF